MISRLLLIQLQLERCWTRYPAFFYGLSAVIGASYVLYKENYLSLFWIFCLVLPAISLKKKRIQQKLVLALGIMAATFFLTSSRYFFPPAETTTVSGIAEIEISSISSSKTHFGSAWKYQATLLSFIPDGDPQKTLARNIPVRILIPLTQGSERPSATQRYRLKARLKNNGEGMYTLIPRKNTRWEPMQNVLNLTEWRLGAKTFLQKHIADNISNSHVAAFLSGIATGTFDDMQLKLELGRFGLQHLMAISGLHFSILGALLGTALCIFFSYRIAALLMILLLSSYFLFLGSSASVLRAWVAITIAICGILAGKRSQALNSLGIGLMVIAVWDPLLIQTIAFQFSFAITAAILLWFTPCDLWLQSIFPKRTLSQMADVGWWDQHGYCLLCFLRQALALTIAVNLVALPLTLFYFQKFPLMGLVYNLFFPFMVSFSLLLLLLGLMTAPLPGLSHAIHGMNELYTQFMLNFTFNLPKLFDAIWHVPDIPSELILCYLPIVLMVGLLMKHRSEDSLIAL